MMVNRGTTTRGHAGGSGRSVEPVSHRLETGSTRLVWALAGLASLVLAAGALAEAPRPTLRLQAGGAGDTLTVTAGQPVRMHLDLPGNVGWSDANIGHFVVRTYGKQATISPLPVSGTDYVEYTFSEPGLALIILAAGPASEKGKSDSWQRTTQCTKLIVRVEPAGGAPASDSSTRLDPGLTAKVGDRIEVLPLIAPASLRVGHDLPVRIYFGGGKQKHVNVTAHRGDGSIGRKWTDAVGTTFFKVTQPGRWLIRYEKIFEGTTYTGDLVFDVPVERGGKGGGR